MPDSGPERIPSALALWPRNALLDFLRPFRSFFLVKTTVFGVSEKRFERIPSHPRFEDGARVCVLAGLQPARFRFYRGQTINSLCYECSPD